LYKVKIFLRVSVILISLFFIFITLITLYFNIDVPYLNSGRLTLFYKNPLYLGGISYSLLCASLILRELSDSNFEKRILVVLIVVSMWALYLSYARTFALATFIIYVAYSFNISNNFKKLLLFNFFILLLLIAAYFIFLENINLNKISSGRLLNWESTINNNVDYIQFILGSYVDSGYTQMLYPDSGAPIKQTFQRFANDNTYLEIFINTGAIGLLLFILGLKRLFPTGMMRRLKKVDREGRLVRILSLTYAILISLIITGFFYGSFPSIGNTMNSIVFPVVVSIILILKRHIIAIRRLK
jgi:O-antigen ligase